MKTYREERNEKGFTLIELLIAIVVVGILAAVAIVGIGGLTDTGEESACEASADAAKAAAAAFYANNDNTWPATLQELATDTPDVYEEPTGATFGGSGPSTMTVGSWTLTQTGGGATAPTYGC
jgi:prepilin-type N-terminal cleavage/methylation domain-containing protein